MKFDLMFNILNDEYFKGILPTITIYALDYDFADFMGCYKSPTRTFGEDRTSITLNTFYPEFMKYGKTKAYEYYFSTLLHEMIHYYNDLQGIEKDMDIESGEHFEIFYENGEKFNILFMDREEAYKQDDDAVVIFTETQLDNLIKQYESEVLKNG